MCWSIPISAKNAYCGKFNCIVESSVDMALPVDEKLFEYIMIRAKKWGLAVYEQVIISNIGSWLLFRSNCIKQESKPQDWLITTYLTMNATRNDVFNARNWLLAMGNAAQRLGITIQVKSEYSYILQYCDQNNRGYIIVLHAFAQSSVAVGCCASNDPSPGIR